MTDNMPLKLKSDKAVGAMLGAACGDALGWPNERIGKSREQFQGRIHEFRRWTRHSGGRYFPHDEVIEAGEYSDDTQLILCLCRSLLMADKWWNYFTQVELPFWSAYERGGGGATKRAVDSWLDGIPPWESSQSPKDVKSYFEAGGNGVAMRILPHVLHLNEKKFSDVAVNIFLDGITTHGHPKALLGALVYGFALWYAIRKDSKLAYGELVEELIKNEIVWSDNSAFIGIRPEWKSQAEQYLDDYAKIWESAKFEILDYLNVCRSELSKGALSFDDDVLEKLQCFNKKISGAGTVAAISAIYLASRYAADPLNGIVKAAFAIGSDTDTIASMTGGLLGCINGSDWLLSLKTNIQDTTYIEKSALKVASGQSVPKTFFEPIKRISLKNWIDDIITHPDVKTIKLPDGRQAEMNSVHSQVGRSGKYKVEFRKFATEDGQIIYLNKISKGNFGIQRPSSTAPTKEISKKQLQIQLEKFNLGPKLPVSSFAKSIWFYKEVLGLTIKKKSSDVIVFEQGLVLVPMSYVEAFSSNGFRSLTYVEVTNIQDRYECISESKLKIITQLEVWGQSKRRFFRCLDPDGNIVEVFEKKEN